MVSKRTQDIIKYMTWGGHWLDYPRHPYIKYLQICRFLYMVLGCCLSWQLIFSNGTTYLLSPSAVFGPLMLQVSLTSAVILLSSRDIVSVIRQAERDISSYKIDWEKELLESDTRILVRLGGLVHLSLNSFGALYLGGQLLVDLVKAALGHEEPYTLPLPLEGYIQDPSRRSVLLYVTIVFTDAWFMMALPNTVSYECILFYMASYISSQINIVRRHIKLLQEKCGDGVELLNDWDLDYIIKKHQQIIRLNLLQRKYVTVPYTIQYVLSSISLCLLMYLLNKKVGEDSVIAIMSGTFILFLFGVILIMCFAGEYLERLSTELFYDICDLPWYRQSPRARKNILIMLTEANRTLTLDYRMIITFNLKTYAQIVNSAYSYYTIMNSFS